MVEYNRVPTTTKQQISILQERGLIIHNDSYTRNKIRQIGYFRFKGYCLPYHAEGQSEKFQPNVNFSTIYKTYLFDEEFRELLFGLLERIEIGFKSKLGSFIAQEYHPINYTQCIKNPDYIEAWNKIVSSIISQASKRKELYAKHYKIKYDGQYPIWVILEMASFGNASILFSDMNTADKKKIAQWYGTNYQPLPTWIHMASVARNFCAHHNRLCGRPLPLFINIKSLTGNNHTNTFFSLICVCKYLLKRHDKEKFDSFYHNFKDIIKKYDFDNHLCLLGFPSDWEEKLKRI